MPQVTSVTFTFGGNDEEMNKKRHGYKWHLSYHKAIGLLDSFKAKARVLSPPHMKVFVRRWGLQWELRWCIEWRTSCWWSDGSYDGMGSVLSENIGGIPSQEPSWDEEWETVYHRRANDGTRKMGNTGQPLWSLALRFFYPILFVLIFLNFLFWIFSYIEKNQIV